MEILSINNIVKKFGGYTAVDGISFSVESGKIFGILGPNGAGKTTSIRMITNILKPDSGEIKLFGEPVNPAHQNNMGYLPEERGLYKKIKVIDQLVYFGRLKGMAKEDARRKALEWLKKLDAGDWADKKIQELSKGMQQKVQFISTILHDPDLLILDEPFSGFDPINADLLKNIILDMKEAGKTIMLSTHIMEQVEQLCDDICLIDKGKMLLQGKMRQIKRDFGRDTILMEFDGDDSFLNEFTNIKYINRTKNRVEFRVPKGVDDAKKILQAAASNVEIHTYKFMEPSLNEIFIDVVSKYGESDQ